MGYTPKYNTGISFNHRNKSINVFVNYNYNNSSSRNDIRLYREQLDTIFDGRTIMQNKNRGNGFKTGIDLFINNKNTFGVMINGNIGNNEFNSNTRTPIIYKPTNKTDRLLL